MIFEELADGLENIKKSGTRISQGKSKLTNAPTTQVAQFPAERAAGNDSAQDMRVHDLYRNGLLFTAYDFKGRTTPDLRSFRRDVMLSSVFDSPMSVLANSSSSTTSTAPVANILLPRSKSDVDSVSHKFNDVGDSLITRGGGTATGVLSNVASTAVFGSIESLTQGIMADNGEQIYNTARSMYAGPDNRTKVFTWDLTPRSADDLIQIIRIYEIFNYYSYGVTGNSSYAKEVKAAIDEWYKGTLQSAAPDGAKVENTVFEQITSFLSNVIVVSNPTIWTVRNFGYSTSMDGREDMFGPCQIQSIRFDKTPNGHFNGLAIAPNLPSTFTLEITMREILTLNRGNVYIGGIE